MKTYKPKWTKRHTKIAREFERKKREGRVKEYPVIFRNFEDYMEWLHGIEDIKKDVYELKRELKKLEPEIKQMEEFRKHFKELSPVRVINALEDHIDLLEELYFPLTNKINDRIEELEKNLEITEHYKNKYPKLCEIYEVRFKAKLEELKALRND